MDERARLERRLRRIESFEDPICYGLGIVLAASYFFAMFARGYIATYTWMIPFAIGFVIPRFALTCWAARLEQALRAPPQDEMPAARVVVGAARVGAVTPRAPTKPPEPPPSPRGDSPHFLV